MVHAMGEKEGFYFVPREAIRQLPRFTNKDLESYVLCPTFDPRVVGAGPLGRCLLGTACQHVHADVSGLTVLSMHVNYAWRRLSDVVYERHVAGQSVQVAPPNSRKAVDVMDTSYLLATRALTSKRRPLSHCAHYYFNRQCDLGADCRFVHAVYVDPHARPHQRAPAPVQMGRQCGAALSASTTRVSSKERAPNSASSTFCPEDSCRSVGTEGHVTATGFAVPIRPTMRSWRPAESVTSGEHI
jgi:hypothetical protein